MTAWATNLGLDTKKVAVYSEVEFFNNHDDLVNHVAREMHREGYGSDSRR